MSKMKKRLWVLAVYITVVLIATTGIIAYLTSEEQDVNAMTMGNVSIGQIEQERDGEVD